LGSPGNGSIPNRRGFDEFYGYLDQNHAHNSYPEHLWQNQDEVFLRENWFDQRKTFVPDQLAAKALEFAGRDSTQPFFLYWATTIPHANNELGRARGNGMEVPSDEPYSREDWPQVEKNYAAAVTRLDRDGGRLLDLLRQRGLDRNTLVIFSSDNGPHREGGHDPEFFRSSGPLRGIKRDLYEGGIRVPAIAWWPGRITPGRVVDTPWAFWDFPATAAELAGIPAPPGDGVSCAPLLDNATPARRLPLYWEFHEGGFAQAVREGDWKLVRQKPTFQPELYNLRDDPGERRNLAAAEPQRVAALLALLRSSRHPSTNFPAPGDPPSA
jgi:arylsulfatase A-like enzyme